MAPEVVRGDGRTSVVADGYRVHVGGAGPFVVLEDGHGTPWARLSLAWSVHTVGSRDETYAIRAPTVDQTREGIRLVFETRSVAWRRKRIVFECREDSVGAWAEVEGDGDLEDVCLFGGYSSASPAKGTGWFGSGALFGSVFSPEPGPIERLVLPAHRATSIDVVGGSYPGRGHWFFTPPPFCLGFTQAAFEAPDRVPAGPWLMCGLFGRPGERTYTGLHYEVDEEASWLRLAYEGKTRVSGAFRTPVVRFRFGFTDPYAGIRWYADALRAEGLAPSALGGPRPAWWEGPIFCGWGAQSYIAGQPPGWAPDVSRQDRYDHFLRALEERGLRPMTVVVDDRWQGHYGANEADPDRWGDLRGWIRSRHGAGQRVLLWLKAWDPDGLSPEECVTNAAGIPVAADPSSPIYEARLRASVRRMLGADGYDADGFKVDFTANTPSGPGLRRHGREWGVELLARLLRIIHEEAHVTKPDSLVVTHAPDPQLADASDMIRLNDALRLSDPPGPRPVVAQMRHRAAIVRAANPDVLIDTDDWAMPDLPTWRAYQAAKPELGVPSLYYVSHIDRSGEALAPSDYALLRDMWRDLPAPVMQRNRKPAATAPLPHAGRAVR